MIIKAGSDLGNSSIVKNKEGKEVSFLLEFNTETKEAVVLATLRHTKETEFASLHLCRDKKGKSVTFNCHLPNYSAYNKETGIEII